jgi:TonB family protein
LPEELRSLDRELSGIRIEERPSFAPELERELTRAWQRKSVRNPGTAGRWRRILVAAAVAGLMIVGLSVPSARAAVVRLVRDVAQEARALFEPPPVPEVELPLVPVEEPAPPPPEARTEMVVSPVDPSEEVETGPPEMPAVPAVEITLPQIVSRQEAAGVIASRYPRELQEAGVEGTVKLQFWLDGQGRPENIQIRRRSGNDRLDYAAMLAVREIRFRPATRNGVGVGTWVEVDVHFFALTGSGIIGSDSTGAGS